MFDNKQRNHQWRIQDFPEGCQPQRVCANLFYLINVCQRLHENERNWTEGRGMRQVATPPPTITWIRHWPFQQASGNYRSNVMNFGKNQQSGTTSRAVSVSVKRSISKAHLRMILFVNVSFCPWLFPSWSEQYKYDCSKCVDSGNHNENVPP